MFVGMELVKELVETVLLTGRLQQHSPISLLLISDPEGGKTRVLFETPCSAAIVLTDVTGRALQELCRMSPDKTHFVINDLVAVLSHKQQVNKYTISMINAMTEEGIVAVAFPGQVEAFKSGKRGIIAALTTTMTKDGRQWWNKIGLTSRMLPFCFQAGQDLVIKIMSAINGDSDGIEGKEFRIPSIPIKVAFPQKETKQVHAIAQKKAKEFEEVGFRRLKQFRALVRAHALRRTWKKPEVNQEDVNFLKKIYPYIDYSRPGIL